MDLSRAERTRLEVEAGRLRVFKDMAGGILNKLKDEYGFENIILKANSPDPRTWLVDAYIPGVADPVVEEFYTFPTAETIAMMTLYKATQK